MCFAPAADAAVGGIVVAVGADALRHVRSPRQLGLGSLPLLFGLHQLTEAFVWWGLQGHVSHPVERAALWVYLVFAFAVLPVLVPVAVGLIEPSIARRRVIGAGTVLGVFVGGDLLVALLRGPINASLQAHHLAYHVDALHGGGALTAVYVLVTCGVLLACSYPDIAVLGAVNLAAVPVLIWLTVSGFVSLWCFWAAVVSVVIALHLRRSARGRLEVVVAGAP